MLKPLRPQYNDSIANTPSGEPVVFSDEMSLFVDDLINFIIGEDWREVGETGQPDFDNGWVNFSATTRSLAFRKAGNQVFVKGVIKSGTMNNLSSPVFNLPEEYRDSVFINISTMSDAELVRVNISPSGDVTLFGDDASPSFVLMEFSYMLGE